MAADDSDDIDYTDDFYAKRFLELEEDLALIPVREGIANAMQEIEEKRRLLFARTKHPDECSEVSSSREDGGEQIMHSGADCILVPLFNRTMHESCRLRIPEEFSTRTEHWVRHFTGLLEELGSDESSLSGFPEESTTFLDPVYFTGSGQSLTLHTTILPYIRIGLNFWKRSVARYETKLKLIALKNMIIQRLVKVVMEDGAVAVSVLMSKKRTEIFLITCKLYWLTE